MLAATVSWSANSIWLPAAREVSAGDRRLAPMWRGAAVMVWSPARGGGDAGELAAVVGVVVAGEAVGAGDVDGAVGREGEGGEDAGAGGRGLGETALFQRSLDDV